MCHCHVPEMASLSVSEDGVRLSRPLDQQVRGFLSEADHGRGHRDVALVCSDGEVRCSRFILLSPVFKGLRDAVGGQPRW